MSRIVAMSASPPTKRAASDAPTDYDKALGKHVESAAPGSFLRFELVNGAAAHCSWSVALDGFLTLSVDVRRYDWLETPGFHALAGDALWPDAGEFNVDDARNVAAKFLLQALQRRAKADALLCAVRDVQTMDRA